VSANLAYHTVEAVIEYAAIQITVDDLLLIGKEEAILGG
jgi:hypothetical protein